MLLGAISEVVTIGALLPFLSIIADPQGSPVLVHIGPLLSLVGAQEPDRELFVLTGLFAVAALLAAALRLLLLWASNSFVYGTSSDLGVKLYADTLHQPYPFHIFGNSSEIIASINKVAIVTNTVLMALMQGVIALVISVFIVAGLIIVDPAVALSVGLGCLVIYLAASAAAHAGLRRNGSVISRAQTSRVKTMQEGLGGIRDVLLDQSQPVFIEAYTRAEVGLRDARIRNGFLAGAPRFLVEAVGMVMIAVIAVLLAERSGGLAKAIPVLGALALGAQRLLPMIQQVYNGWAQVLGNRKVLLDVVTLLRRPSRQSIPAAQALPFEKAISLIDVAFSYDGACAPALAGVTVEFPKGARVGIAGRTGSGKSTLMDLVLGLLDPTHGEVRVDGVRLTAENRVAWQRNVAHVPQTIYLADASVAENIAFGIRPEEIDYERLRRAAAQAELTEVLAGLPHGLDTKVGERGIQLSGGQRQRIGIARALYKQASVLVFDEATSALDVETEAAVMAAIDRLDRNLTILIIAHRLTTLERCDTIVKLDRGTATRLPPSSLR